MPTPLPMSDRSTTPSSPPGSAATNPGGTPRAPVEGSTPPGRPGLPDAQRPGGLDLAAYLLTRHLRYGPVPARQRDRLLQAQQAVEQVRRSLPLGRSNVDVDVVATAGAAAWRGLAVSMAEERVPVPDLPDEHLEAFALGIRGAAVAHFGAGTCDDHAALSVVTAAPHLTPGEALTTRVLPDPPHAWAEQVAAQPEGEERIVLDAWAEGPAILAQDGAFSAQPDVIEDVRITLQEAPVVLLAHTVTGETLSAIPGFAPAALEARLRQQPSLNAENVVRPEYPAMPVLSPLALFLALHRADRSLAQRAAVGDASAGSLAQLDAARRAAEADSAAPVAEGGAPAGPAPVGGQAAPVPAERLSVRDPLRPVRTALAATAVARSLGATVNEATALAGPLEQAARGLRTRVRFPAEVASPEAQMTMAQTVPPTTRG